MKVILLFLVILITASAHADNVPFYATIATSLQQDQSLPISKDIQYEIDASDPDLFVKRLSQWQGIEAEPKGSDKVIIRQRSHPQFTGPVIGEYLKPSFVVDFDESSVTEHISGFKVEDTGVSTLEQLTAYVNRYIDAPTYIHGFNIASVVARNRSGDCTEYAVLTAALARGLSYAARVVFGTVILSDENKISAYGHAWTEVWDEGKWQIVDAALYTLAESHVFYLPVAALENEGLGYATGVLKATQSLPSGLHAIQNASP